MSTFQLDLPVTQTRFGAGCATEGLKTAIDRAGTRRALVVCTEKGAARYRPLIESLNEHCVGVFNKAQPHCPVDIAMQALRSFILAEADCIVAIGGGSTLGLGKFIAAQTGKPWFAIPTTFSGSEMTSLYGVKIESEKRTRKNTNCRAKAIFYDTDIAATLPAHETAATGMNCLAHCVEALYAPTPNPLAIQLGIEGAAILHRSLPKCVENPADKQARQDALYAGFIGGLLVETVGIGMHHKICHVIGGHYDVAHADSNSAVLPHVLAFNQEVLGQTSAALANALEAVTAATGVYALAKDLDVPLSLRELGVNRDHLPILASECMQHIQHNPRIFTEKNLLEILEHAWHGKPPEN